MHHTKEKGDLGVLRAAVDLARKGFKVFTPMSEHLGFDLAAYKDGIFKRVQVKYRTLVNGSVSFRASTNWSDKSGTHILPMDKDEVDLVCLYCPDVDKCYYIDPKKMNTTLRLRVEPTKNMQQKGIKLAADFESIPL